MCRFVDGFGSWLEKEMEEKCSFHSHFLPAAALAQCHAISWTLFFSRLCSFLSAFATVSFALLCLCLCPGLCHGTDAPQLLTTLLSVFCVCVTRCTSSRLHSLTLSSSTSFSPLDTHALASLVSLGVRR